MELGTHAREIVQQLRDATGLQVTLDPRDLQVPGVIVFPQTIDFDRFEDTTGSATWDVVLVASYSPDVALDDLGDMLTRIRQHVHLTDIRATAYADPSLGADTLPALQGTLNTEWSDENGD